jgi:hypothetical protein
MITTIRSIGQFSAEILMMHSLKTILFGSSQYTSIAEALRISKTAIQTAQM